MGSKSQTQLEREASIAIMTTIVVVVFVVCNSFESLLFILHSQELLTGNYYSEPYSQFCSYFINFFLFLVFILPAKSLKIFQHIPITHKVKSRLMGGNVYSKEYVYRFFQMFQKSRDCSIYQTFILGDVVQDFLRPLADLVMVFNSSVNVIIYCIFNRAFREKFIEMYFFWCKKKGKESAVEIPMGAQSVPKSSTQATKSSDVVSQSKEQQDTPL